MSKRQIPQADAVRMPLDMLLPADYNPRRISDRAMKGLRASLERFGELGGIVYNKRTGRLVGGHQRVKALAAMGVKDAEVRVVDLPVAEEKAANLALNHPGIGGEWDEALLAVVLAEVERDLPTAYEELQLDDLIGEAASDELAEGLTDPDDVPEPMPDTVTRVGDVWVLGDHRIICGSCTDAGAVARVMNGERADLCLTDPPYGLGNTNSEKNDYAEYDDTRDNLVDLVAAFLPIAQAVAPVVVLTPGCMNAHIYPRPLWTMAWFTPAGAGVGPWGWVCWQPILCYGKDPKTQKGKGSHPDAIVHTEASEKFGHPCTKPIKFWCWLTERTSERGETIYEPFSGSGTTIIAGEMTGRRVRAVELSPQYVDIAVTRWQTFTGKTATLDGDGRTFDEVKDERHGTPE